ncbi:3-dehydroquinate dehydratase [Bacteroidales bacterium CF]|jgi:3-dehydroquinate dehydratase|nr:3-dehydroquinate dehydratase [Bacteroidales bacterium CF]
MLCRSIAVEGSEKILSLIEGAEMAEIRIEMSNLSSDEVRVLFAKHKSLIATCRPGDIPDKTRKALLKAAIDGGAEWVDIEIESDDGYMRELVRYAKANDCKVIISYHNYKSTPDKEYLERIIERSLSEGADLVKIATMANSDNDNSTLISLYRPGRALLSIGMGELGRVTRIEALKRGAPFTFVIAPGSQESAPGQYSEAEMKKILGI